MNPQQNEELVKYRCAKAKETLAEIDVLIQNKLWNIAVNKLYYACFYAVSALLAERNIFPKTHTGTRQMFGLHFVKAGKITAASSIFYGEIFEKRQDGDYEDFIDFGENDVLILIAPAKELISEIENILFPNQ